MRGRAIPGLNGLRALAVLAVFAFHLSVHGLGGGYLGVDLFFVLSGFLITSLLVEERMATGTTRWWAFWSRRLTRLVPALLAVLILVTLAIDLLGWSGHFHGTTSDLDIDRQNGLGALFYCANWVLIHWVHGHAYDPLVSDPFGHTWSLSIEEQFYLLWPAVVVGTLVLLGRRWRVVAAGATGLLAVLSAFELDRLSTSGSASSAYYGTVPRAFDLLVGASLAFLLAGGVPDRLSDTLRRVIGQTAWLAAVLLGVFWSVGGTAAGGVWPWMYRWGFALCALLSAWVVAGVVLRPTRGLGRLLSWSPLVGIGIISYGLYLWHLPVIVVARIGWPTWRGFGADVVVVAVTGALAGLSWVVVERPLRHRPIALRSTGLIWAVSMGITAIVVVAGLQPWVVAPTLLSPVATTAMEPAVPGGPVPGEGGVVGGPLHVDHVVDNAHPLVVMLVGDAQLEVSASGIAAALGATHEVVTYDEAGPGFSLDSPSLDDALLLDLIQAHPNIVVADWSTDDREAAAHPAAFAKRLQALVEKFTLPGTGVSDVLFLDHPASPGTTGTEDPGALAWADAAVSVARALPDRALFLPVAAALATPTGRFTTWLAPGNRPTARHASWVRVRMTRGVALCQNGTVRLASALLGDLRTLVPLVDPGSGWVAASWTKDPIYDLNTEAGRCPNDHPPTPSA